MTPKMTWTEVEEGSRWIGRVEAWGFTDRNVGREIELTRYGYTVEGCRRVYKSLNGAKIAAGRTLADWLAGFDAPTPTSRGAVTR